MPNTNLDSPTLPSGSASAASHTGDPRITVVTPSYNQAAFLRETIDSVLGQEYSDLEYMILDGGSADGSASIIESYGDRLAFWVSRPDGGQASAIREGFSRSTGEILAWLNSDDQYLPGALSRVADAYRRNPGALVVAPVINYESNGRRVLIEQKLLEYPRILRFWRRRFQFHQPGMFFPRSAYEEAGGLDATLHYTMDFDLLIRLLRNGIPVVYLETPVALFRLHDRSKTVSQNTEMALEAYRVVERYWGDLKSNRFKLVAFMATHLFGRALKLGFRGEVRESWRTVVGAATLVPAFLFRRS